MRSELTADAEEELCRQVYFLSVGIDSLEALSLILPNAMDNEVGLTGEQVGHLLKCVEYSLLTTQRKIVAALGDTV